MDVLRIVPGFYVSMDETGEREVAVRVSWMMPRKK